MNENNVNIKKQQNRFQKNFLFITTLLFITYVLLLMFFTIDKSLDLGITASKVEKDLKQKIEILEYGNEEEYSKVKDEFINLWMDLVVDDLLKVMQKRRKPGYSRALECLKEITEKDFGNDISRWLKWWEEYKKR